MIVWSDLTFLIEGVIIICMAAIIVTMVIWWLDHFRDN